jgi:hypothetical protein
MDGAVLIHDLLFPAAVIALIGGAVIDLRDLLLPGLGLLLKVLRVRFRVGR